MDPLQKPTNSPEESARILGDIYVAEQMYLRDISQENDAQELKTVEQNIADIQSP